jgi:hypothetical protein
VLDYSCEKPFKKKNNQLTVTCPKCGIESEVLNKTEYFTAGGVICHNCKNIIPQNKKFENKRENWVKKTTATDVAKGARLLAGVGIGTILIGIVGLFVLLCVVLIL